jgi:hypothetical protein
MLDATTNCTTSAGMRGLLSSMALAPLTMAPASRPHTALNNAIQFRSGNVRELAHGLDSSLFQTGSISWGLR